MKVLVACEFSGIVRDAFIAAGHDAISCDLLPTESPGPHIQGDVRGVLDRGWDLLIAHPHCTYLANSGVHHLWDNRPSTSEVLRGEDRVRALQRDARFFNLLRDAPVPRVCVESSIPHKYAVKLVGPYTQLVRSWQHGGSETKGVCLWLRGLPPLRDTNVTLGNTGHIIAMSPGVGRAHERSKFFPGIAKAMAAQWGRLG